MMDASLGTYLRERRSRLDLTALGYAVGRRHTPGLRREEVAQRSDISTTWYSWLEQERGGVTPRLQRVLDAMDSSSALIRTVVWDVVAWNDAAAAILTDYGGLPPRERNVLRLIFLDPRSRATNLDWEGVARFVVGVFRADAARAGASATIEPLVEELRRRSPEFAAMWDDGDVRGFDEGVKHLRHPVLGAIAIEYSAFAVDGRPDLTMLVYNPTNEGDAERIRSLVETRSRKTETATVAEEKAAAPARAS